MRASVRLSMLLMVALVAVFLAPRPDSAAAAGTTTVVAGGAHSCALTTAGGVKCWGFNLEGQLGDGTVQNRATPVDVFGLTSGVTDISAGEHHTCAVTTSGGVKCWGRNAEAQLGNGGGGNPGVFSPTPVDVVGLQSGVARVAAGQYHTCALTTLGGVKCWGKNEQGQLGDGRACGILVCMTPVNATGLSSGATAIAAGGHHNCVVTAEGGLKCWGWNASGEVGDGTLVQRNTPVDVTGLPGGVAATAVGGRHSCAVTTDGGVKCWGFNLYGQLGDGTTTTRAIPTDVAGITSDGAAVGAGFFHSCAVTTSRVLKCWGHNGFGQLGDAQACSSPCTSPVNVWSLFGIAEIISPGSFHTCARTVTQYVRCWGSNQYGQVGDGTSGNIRTAPVDVAGLGPKATPTPTPTPAPTPTPTPTPFPVGGVAELPSVAGSPTGNPDRSGRSVGFLLAVAATIATVAAIGGLAFAVGRARRR